MLDPIQEARAKELDRELAEEDAGNVREEKAPVEKPREPEPVEQKVEDKQEVEEKPEPRKERQVYNISLEKHNRQLENARKIKDEEISKIREEARQKAIEELRNERQATVSEPENDESDIEEFAKKYEVDEDVIRSLTNLVSKRTGQKKEAPVDESLQRDLAEWKQERAMMKAQKEFETDFQRDIIPLIQKENPNASLEVIQRVRGRLDELAFSEDFSRYRLEHIFKIYKDDFDLGQQVNAETSRGGARSSTTNFADLTAEQIEALSPEETDRYFEWHDAQRKGSKYKN